MHVPEAPDEARSAELLARLRAGEAGAFDVLYRRHRDELLLAVRAGMGPALRAAMQSEDVLQSVAIEAFAVLQRSSPPAGGFTALLRRIVRHRLIDRARAVRRRRVAGGLTESTAGAAVSPAPPSYSDQRYERLERALAALPAELREVIRQRRFAGLSTAEIAMRTGRSEDAVRKQLSRAMARLTSLVGCVP
jgi:RNA polymerase sigma factor (sigma-70 family)